MTKQPNHSPWAKNIYSWSIPELVLSIEKSVTKLGKKWRWWVTWSTLHVDSHTSISINKLGNSNRIQVLRTEKNQQKETGQTIGVRSDTDESYSYDIDTSTLIKNMIKSETETVVDNEIEIRYWLISIKSKIDTMVDLIKEDGIFNRSLEERKFKEEIGLALGDGWDPNKPK